MNRRAWPRALKAACAAVLLLSGGPASAEVSAADDTGQRIRLPAPATRIVSLAPHLTELLFAAGAGSAVVGVSEYSDYPPGATRLPSVGNSQRIDIERVLALRPDLVVGWQSGNSSAQLARLRRLGIPVFISEPRRMEAIATSLERLGALAGTADGSAAAARFRRGLQQLRERYGQQRAVSVFYQVWPTPLMTLNDEHIVSEAIRLCGGVNVFAGLRPLVPTVSREAVISTDPELIVASNEPAGALEGWQAFGGMRAVRNRRMVVVDGSLMNRAGPRMLEATRFLCEQIATVRQPR